MNLSAFIRTITGKNKTGQIIYGALDVLPIPPIHNIVRQAFAENVKPKDMPKFVWQKMDKLWLSTSLIALGLSFATVKGWITVEDMKLLIEYLELFL
jgi:hypothetical protein